MTGELTDNQLGDSGLNPRILLPPTSFLSSPRPVIDGPTFHLDAYLSSPDRSHKRIALLGDEASGKSQALCGYLHNLREDVPDVSIFWCTGASAWEFEQDFIRIAFEYELIKGVRTVADLKSLILSEEALPRRSRADHLAQITEHLSSPAAGTWILVVDGADNEEVFFSTPRNHLFFTGTQPSTHPPRTRLIHYLPYSRTGFIIFTTRKDTAARRLTGTSRIIEMLKPEADSIEAIVCDNLRRLDLHRDSEDPIRMSLAKVLECNLATADIVKATVTISQMTLLQYIESYQTATEEWFHNYHERVSHTEVDYEITKEALWASYCFLDVVDFLFPQMKQVLEICATCAGARLHRSAVEMCVEILTSKGQLKGISDQAMPILESLGFIDNDFYTMNVELRKFIVRDLEHNDDFVNNFAIAVCVLAYSMTPQKPWHCRYLLVPLAVDVILYGQLDDDKGSIKVLASLATFTVEFLITHGVHADITLSVGQRALHIWQQIEGPHTVHVLNSWLMLCQIVTLRGPTKDAVEVCDVALGQCQEALALACSTAHPHDKEWVDSGEILDTKQQEEVSEEHGSDSQVENINRLKILEFSIHSVRSHNLMKLGRYQEAISTLRDAEKLSVNIHGDHAIAVEAQLAIALANVGEFQEASKMFQTVLALSESETGWTVEQLSAIHLQYANVLISQERYTDAEDIFRRLIFDERHARDPSADQLQSSAEWEALVGLGICYLVKQDIEGAERCFRNAAGGSTVVVTDMNSSSDGTALEWLALVLDMNGNEEAAFWYQRAIRAHESQHGYGSHMAGTCYQQYQRFLEDGPGNIKIEEGIQIVRSLQESKKSG